MDLTWLINSRIWLDIVLVSIIAILLFSRIKEPRTVWLLRGYLFLVSVAWALPLARLPISSSLADVLVIACSLSLGILWQGELRRLMELLGTGKISAIFGNPQEEFQAGETTITQLSDSAGKLSQLRRGALIVIDMGSDLRPEDFCTQVFLLMQRFQQNYY